MASPSPPLSRHVESVVAIDARCAFRSLTSLPKPATELFIDLGGSRAGRRSLGAWIAGAREEPLRLDADGTESFVAVRFRPGGAWALFGIPACEFLGGVVPALSLAPLRWTGALRDRLLASRDVGERLRLVIRALEPLAARARAEDPWLHAAIAAELASGGRLPVHEMCRFLGLTRRGLVGGFVREVGLPPKRFCRLVRFHRAFQLVCGSEQSLPDIALECGYTDQSHLTNEFRDLAGVPPARLRAMGPHRIDETRFVPRAAR